MESFAHINGAATMQPPPNPNANGPPMNIGPGPRPPLMSDEKIFEWEW